MIPRNGQEKGGGGSSRGLQGIHLEDVLVGRGGEVQLLVGHSIVTGAAQPQSPLKVQQLTHEVEVGRNVGLLHLDDIVGVVHGQVELLHEVGHRHRDRAADPRQAMHQDAAVLPPCFICVETKRRTRKTGGC